MSAPSWDSLVFPKLPHGACQLELVNAYPDWRAAEALPDGGDPSARSALLYALWAAGVLETKGSAAEEFVDLSALLAGNDASDKGVDFTSGRGDGEGGGTAGGGAGGGEQTQPKRKSKQQSEDGQREALKPAMNRLVSRLGR